MSSAVTNSNKIMSEALAEQCLASDRIRFAVSFVMESGVKVCNASYYMKLTSLKRNALLRKTPNISLTATGV